MSFEGLLRKDMLLKGFGNSAYLRSFKERPHMSKSSMERDGLARYVSAQSSLSVVYDEMANRYIAARSVTYDLIVSVYEINSRALLVCRVGGAAGMSRPLERFLGSLRVKGRRNLEARMIGLQSGKRFSGLSDILKSLDRHNIPIYEIDLFGDQIRNIAIDSKLGPSYDILMLDRIYRPGELKNTLVVKG